MKSKILAISLLTVMGAQAAGAINPQQASDILKKEALNTTTTDDTTGVTTTTTAINQETETRNIDGSLVATESTGEIVTRNQSNEQTPKDSDKAIDTVKVAAADTQNKIEDARNQLPVTGNWFSRTFISNGRGYWAAGLSAAAIGLYVAWQKYCEAQELLMLEKEVATQELKKRI